MKAILGKKIGMTQIFKDDGSAVAVTVVECGPCTVLQRKTIENDGYSAIQLGFGAKKARNAIKSEQGRAKKANTDVVARYVQEFRVPKDFAVEVGNVLTANIFEAGESVAVTGTTIGKGFQGAIKRHGFTIGPKSHGSKNHRITGTQGAMDRGGRIPTGQKKPGHMGMDQVTMRGLKIVEVLTDKNVVLISGAIPGPKNGLVVVSNRTAEYDASKLTKK
jgi:large subunit ribosomal protein L3